MDCAEIRSGFVSGSIPEGPAVAEHVKICPHCGELFEKGGELGRRLAHAVLPATGSGDLLQAVERDLGNEVGARARLRALPTSLRAVLLVGVGLVLLAWQLVLRRRPDFGDYSAEAFWGVALVFIIALLFGSLVLLRGPTAPSRSLDRQGWIALLLLMVPAFAALLAAWGLPYAATTAGQLASEPAAAWGSPGSCFSYGGALVIPFILLAWLFERRERVPVAALLMAGALAGVTANLLLHAHCPSVHLGHLLLGHATIGVAWALGLGLLSARIQRPG